MFPVIDGKILNKELIGVKNNHWTLIIFLFIADDPFCASKNSADGCNEVCILIVNVDVCSYSANGC